MQKEGNLEAPSRHAIPWRQAQFYDPQDLQQELARVYDICHGCRRCVSLCDAFPTLFDLIDNSPTMEVDGVAAADYNKVVEQCYLCDLCFMTKCPYTPPHEWNVDFPHLMLRAKAVAFQQEKPRWRDRLLTSVDKVGRLGSLPLLSWLTNTVTDSFVMRWLMHRLVGIHQQAVLPRMRWRWPWPRKKAVHHPAIAAGKTRGRVALYVTCYGRYYDASLERDLMAVFDHNKIAVEPMQKEQCCGMPKMEIGDLEAVERAMEANIPRLLERVEAGWDLVAPVPSCSLMYKQELPLLFPDNEAVAKVAAAMYDPFEYLALRHQEGLLDTDFKHPIGRVLYHPPCHLRVQNFGLKTRDLLRLLPQSEIHTVARCSGHDGTYGVRRESFPRAARICQPIVTEAQRRQSDVCASDCPMAGRHIARGMNDLDRFQHPMHLLRRSYGI